MTLIVTTPPRPPRYTPRHQNWYERNMRAVRWYRIRKALRLTR